MKFIFEFKIFFAELFGPTAHTVACSKVQDLNGELSLPF